MATFWRHLGFFSWSQVSLLYIRAPSTAVVSFVSSRKAPLCGEVRCVTKLRTVVQQTISRGYERGISSVKNDI